MPGKLLASVVLWLFVLLPFPLAAGEDLSQENPFPLLPGLEGAIDFWKQIFTRYKSSELIFHDPLDPGKIYQVIEVGENARVNRIIDEERKKIMREHGLKEKDQRVRAQRGVKELFASGLRLSRKYLDQMQKILQEEDVPIELAYLPLVESSFNIRARSRAGALGMWQFMPSTGRRFLRISSTVDERRDPLESTRAAARFLKENYRIFGNWPLAITAYNHGREGVLRAVAEVGSSDLMEIIRRYQSPSFGFASKSFYAEFLAAIEVAKRSAEFFPEVEYHPPFPLEELELKRAISVPALLKHVGVPRSEFFEWNPALNAQIHAIPSGYRIKIPPEKLNLFLSAYGHLVKLPSGEPELIRVKMTSRPWKLHRVSPGETLSQLARRYGTSVDEIKRLNGLKSTHRISAGQYLKIPRL